MLHLSDGATTSVCVSTMTVRFDSCFVRLLRELVGFNKLCFRKGTVVSRKENPNVKEKYPFSVKEFIIHK